jgi:hypothetical protein
MKHSSLGGLVGGIIGFLVGASIPSPSGVNISFLQRLTGNIVIEDPQGLIVSMGYALIGACVIGAIGVLIGSNFDKKDSW